MNIKEFWSAVLRQDADAIREYFHSDGWVNWHNTNEHFTMEEFIRANCEYPGEWDGEVEREERIGDLVITATHVYIGQYRSMLRRLSSCMMIRLFPSMNIGVTME